MAAPDVPATWADYHTRRRLFWASVWLGPWLALAIGALWLVERHGVHGLLWPLLAWLALVAWTGAHWQASRCPRCGHRFFPARPFLLALRAPRCAHCALPKD